MLLGIVPGELATGVIEIVDARGRRRTVLVAKATFALRAGAVAAHAPPIPLVGARFGAQPASAISADQPADDVLYKPRADVVVTASLGPPPGLRVPRWIAGFSVARGAEVLLEKRRVVSTTWRKDRVGDQRLHDPDGTVRRDGFGVVGDVAPSAADPVGGILDGDVDLSRLQAAPPDQQLPHLRGGEQILLSGLSPRAWDAHVRLPAVTALASIDGGAAGVFALACDTLWIDADRMIATLTYRGVIDAVLQGADGEVRAYLVPCRAVEEVAGAPPAWRKRGSLARPGVAAPAAPHGPDSRRPSEDDVRLVDATSLVVTTFPSPLGSGSDRVVVVKGTFVLVPGGPARRAEAQAPLSHDTFAPDGSLAIPSDLAPHKVRADVLLDGIVHAEAGRQAAIATLELGPVRRRIAAFGPREWTTAGVPGAPGPFVPVALAYANAVGGVGTANPVGVDTAASKQPPRLEDPERLVARRGDRPPAACSSGLSPTWPGRASLSMGTFDARWRAARWPLLPADANLSYFQCAPAPQQCTYLRGDEPYRLGSMAEDGGTLEGSLPGVMPRAFLIVLAEPEEIDLRLDTVRFDAVQGTVTLVWRGMFELAARALPVTLVVLAEDQRMPRDDDRSRARAFALATEGPFGAASRDAPPEPAQTPRFLAAELPVLSRRGAREALRGALGVSATAAAALPLAPPPAGRGDVLALVARGGSLRGRDLSGADLSGMDLSGRDLERAILAGADLTGAKLDGARLGGASLARASAQGASLRGADLSSADLERAHLEGADLSEAKLHRANLSGAHMAGARLEGAAAREAQLVGADLTRVLAGRCDLTKADLSNANLEAAALQDAILDDARLYEATGTTANLDRASLVDARFEKARFEGASFREARAPGAVWERALLRGAIFVGANLRGAVFSGAELWATDFQGADARDATFRRSDLQGARLERANLAKANFESAVLQSANLRGANLYQAETLNADLAGADLEGAFVAGTKLA